jgi:hypothetical protein
MRDEFVRPIESAEECRFTTTRGTDQSGDLVGPDDEVDIFEGVGSPVIEV